MSTGVGRLLVGDVVGAARHRDGAAGRRHHDARHAGARRRLAHQARAVDVDRVHAVRVGGLVRDHPGQVVDLIDARDGARDVVGRRHRARHNLDVRARDPSARPAARCAPAPAAAPCSGWRACRTRCAPRNPVPPVTSVGRPRPCLLHGTDLSTRPAPPRRAPRWARASCRPTPRAPRRRPARVATPSRRFSTTRWVNAATSRHASCAGRPVGQRHQPLARQGKVRTTPSARARAAPPSPSAAPRSCRPTCAGSTPTSARIAR